MSVPGALENDPLLKDVPIVLGYKVLEPCVLYAAIGRGGMGAVYRGKHLNLEMDVAVKCLKSSLAAESPEFIVRFQREARVAAAVSDANLIRVFDVANRYGVHYLVMEYVEGENLQARVSRKGPLALDEALTIAIGVANGLSAAHERGITHRDVKPANILISRRGETKLADLGLARVADAIDSLATGTHMVLGTPQYMPPEQFENTKGVGPAGDVHALASCLWFMLAGKNAVESGSLAEVMRRVVLEPFPDLRSHRTGLPDELYDLIARATDRSPKKRPQSAQVFADELAAISRHHGLRSTLKDPDAGTVQEPQGLVSPPPEATLSRIKTLIDSGALRREMIDVLAKEQATSESSSIDSPIIEEPKPRSDRDKERDSHARADAETLKSQPKGSQATTRIGIALAVIGMIGLLLGLFFQPSGAQRRAKVRASGPSPAMLVPGKSLVAYLGFSDPRSLLSTIREQIVAFGPASSLPDDAPDVLMKEHFSQMIGLGFSSVEDLEALGIAPDSFAFASYDGGIEFAAFRCADRRKCRIELVKLWEAQDSRSVKTAVKDGFEVIEQHYESSDTTDRFALLRDDRVYVANRDDVSKTLNLLNSAGPETLEGVRAFQDLMRELPPARQLVAWINLDSSLVLTGRENFMGVFGTPAIGLALGVENQEFSLDFAAPLESNSLLSKALVPNGSSLLAGRSYESLLLGLEIAVEPNRLLDWLSDNGLNQEIATFLAGANFFLGLNLRTLLSEGTNGRVAWIMGSEDGGEVLMPTGKGQGHIRIGKREFPVPTGMFEEGITPGKRFGIPKFSVLLGANDSGAKIVAAIDGALDRIAEKAKESGNDSGVEVTRKNARTVEITIPEENLQMTYHQKASGRGLEIKLENENSNIGFELATRSDQIALSLQDMDVGPSRSDGGARSFDAGSESVLRLYADVDGILRRVLPLVTDREAREVIERLISNLKRFSMDIRREGAHLIGRARIGENAASVLSDDHRSRKSMTLPILGAVLALAGLMIAFFGRRTQ